MRKAVVALALAAGMAVTGCAGTDKTTTGTGVGAVAGAAIGAAIGGKSVGGRVAGAVIGGAIGALIGHQIGRYLDERDRRLREEAHDVALDRYRTGNTRRWRNTRSGNSGTITPTSARYRRDNRVCRNFTETVQLKNGRNETIRGRKCQKPDGSWEFVGA